LNEVQQEPVWNGPIQGVILWCLPCNTAVSLLDTGKHKTCCSV
jgi:hypothetical protein